ncbi:PREDICTED: protein FAM50A-like, partial [Gekko japonicus]|uniref:Protein FAM50A-like n=1 Tax=Gekko japonicus TaxID=146911 RepID=A0ABM1JX30_GEKJA
PLNSRDCCEKKTGGGRIGYPGPLATSGREKPTRWAECVLSLRRKLERMRERERKQEQKRKISSLSFTLDEEEEEDGGEEEEEEEVELEREELPTKKRKLGKNPDVDTSFLPDRDREEEENRLREELRQEWEAKQEKIKSEEIEITFSYWDGSGHRRTVKEAPPKGYRMPAVGSLGVRENEPLPSSTGEAFDEPTCASSLPSRTRTGVAGFGVKGGEQRSGCTGNTVSHAGKVVLRSWYEKNKHIFPASRWEPYDPEKKWDKYTIR